MQALAMHSDEKLQCALTLGQQMCITLHPNSSVKMEFFFPSEFGYVFGFPIAVPHGVWIHFSSLNFLLGNGLWISRLRISVKRCYNLTPITGSD